jgi:N-terminal domain of anti-restriction factor ArdC
MRRKGERGSMVVYASKITRTGTDAETGEDCQETIPFLKSYTVFNVEQIEGLPAHFHAVAEPRLDPVQRIERAESFFAATCADIRHGGNKRISLREFLHAQIGRPLCRVFAFAGDTWPERVIAADLLDEELGARGMHLVTEASDPIRMHRASAAA